MPMAATSPTQLFNPCVKAVGHRDHPVGTIHAEVAGPAGSIPMRSSIQPTQQPDGSAGIIEGTRPTFILAQAL